MIWAKSKQKHGEWDKWRKEYCPYCSPGTVCRYMMLARKCKEEYHVEGRVPKRVLDSGPTAPILPPKGSADGYRRMVDRESTYPRQIQDKTRRIPLERTPGCGLGWSFPERMEV